MGVAIGSRSLRVNRTSGSRFPAAIKATYRAALVIEAAEPRETRKNRRSTTNLIARRLVCRSTEGKNSQAEGERAKFHYSRLLSNDRRRSIVGRRHARLHREGLCILKIARSSNQKQLRDTTRQKQAAWRSPFQIAARRRLDAFYQKSGGDERQNDRFNNNRE